MSEKSPILMLIFINLQITSRSRDLSEAKIDYVNIQNNYVNIDLYTSLSQHARLLCYIAT